MSSIVVRGLDDAVKQQLAAQAREHGRSMEAEVRAILTKAAQRPHIGIALLAAAQALGGIEDLPVPVHGDVARAVDVVAQQGLTSSDSDGLRHFFSDDYFDGSCKWDLKRP